MVAKVQGEDRWHSHPDTDDFFLVLEGEIEIDLEGGGRVRYTLNAPAFHAWVPCGRAQVKRQSCL